MRYAIVSDLHSNLEALQAVERDAQDAGAFLCLGDVVGYGADPSAVVAWVRQACEVVTAGNHDRAAAEASERCSFNRDAAAAIRWTAAQLSPDHVAYLSSLPLSARRGDALLVHATPHEPAAWHYLFGLHDAERNFPAFDERICFIGHSHLPGVFKHRNGQRVSVERSGRISLTPRYRYIVNVGSVGQPRDGNPHASYALYDTSADVVELRRVAYELNEAARKIRAAGLPERLATRLTVGR